MADKRRQKIAEKYRTQIERNGSIVTPYDGILTRKDLASRKKTAVKKDKEMKCHE